MVWFWSLLVALAFLARFQEPVGLRRFGVQLYWDSVRSYYWTLSLGIAWLATAWRGEGMNSWLGRVAVQRPGDAIVLSCFCYLRCAIIYGLPYLLTCLALDVVLGAHDGAWRALQLAGSVGLAGLPIAALAPALTRVHGLATRTVVGGVLAVTLVTVLGGGAPPVRATLAAPPMDVTVLRCAGTSLLLTMAAAAVALGVLRTRRG